MAGEEVGLKHPDRTWQEGLRIGAAMEQHDLARRGSTPAWKRWAPVAGAALVAVVGLTRRTPLGWLLAALGGGVALVAAKGRLAMPWGNRAPDGARSLRVRQSIVIDRPVNEVYGAWRDIERLPDFMSHLQSVRMTGDGLSHWTARGPLGQSVEWNAEVFNDDENTSIAWRTVGDADVTHVGAVHFQESGSGRTELTVTIEYMPPAGVVGATVASLLGESPDQQIADALCHFKHMMEHGGEQAAQEQRVEQMGDALADRISADGLPAND